MIITRRCNDPKCQFQQFFTYSSTFDMPSEPKVKWNWRWYWGWCWYTSNFHWIFRFKFRFRSGSRKSAKNEQKQKAKTPTKRKIRVHFIYSYKLLPPDDDTHTHECSSWGLNQINKYQISMNRHKKRVAGMERHGVDSYNRTQPVMQ